MTTLRPPGRLGRWLLAAAAVALAPVTLAAADNASSWDPYRLLSERNIFVRGRRLPAPPRTTSYEPAPPPPVRPRFVLTGTALQRDEFVAFFEDVRTGQTVRARLGDTVGDGRLTDITLDHVDHEADSKVTKVTIGAGLTGERVALPQRAAASPPPTPEPAKPPETPETPGPDAPASASSEAPPAEPAAAAPAVSAPASAPPSTPEASPPPGANDLAEILRRLRERREQELKR